MVTIEIDISLRNFAMYKHKCQENMKKLYASAGTFDDTLQFKYIIE